MSISPVQFSPFSGEPRFPSPSSSSSKERSTRVDEAFSNLNPSQEYPSVGGRISRLDTPSKEAPSKDPVFDSFWGFFNGLSIVDRLNKYHMRLDLLVPYIKAKQALTPAQMSCNLESTLIDLKKLLKGETIVEKSRRDGLYQSFPGAGVVMQHLDVDVAFLTHVSELQLIMDLFDHSTISEEQKREFFYDLREEILSLHVCLKHFNPKNLDHTYFGSEENALLFLNRAVNIVSMMQDHFTY